MVREVLGVIRVQDATARSEVSRQRHLIAQAESLLIDRVAQGGGACVPIGGRDCRHRLPEKHLTDRDHTLAAKAAVGVSKACVCGQVVSKASGAECFTESSLGGVASRALLG